MKRRPPIASESRVNLAAGIAAVQQALKEAIQKLERHGDVPTVAVPGPTADEAELHVNFANIYFPESPALSAALVRLLSRVLPDVRTEVMHYISSLAVESPDTFESEAQKYLDDVARKLERQGLATQQGEPEVSG